MNLFFRYFWLDPKVTKRSRLRALHTPSRRSRVGKSGNLLRFGQPDFLSPRSLLRRLTARGRRTNAEGVRGGIPHYVRNDKGWCAHLRNLRSDNPASHKKRANTRFAPTLTTLITVDYFSLFTFHSSLYKNFGYPFSYAHHIHARGQRKNMVAGGGVHRANE